jgi:hypothetical protein
MSAVQGATVAQWGSGFTPNSTATLHFKKPDGTEFPTTAQVIKTDGSFSISYTIPTDRAAGTYSWWGIDSTGKVSNTVSYSVTAAVPGSISVSPSSGSWTSSTHNLSVSSSGANTIYFNMVNTYDGSTPSTPSNPSASSHDGSLSGSSNTFQLFASSGQFKKTKLKFVGCNNAGCGSVSGSFSYTTDLR